MTSPPRQAVAGAVPANGGIYLSRTKVVGLLVVAIVALAFAFAAGILLDHYVMQPTTSAAPPP